jgi:hypothetical protein
MRKLDPGAIREDFESALHDVEMANDAVLAAGVTRTIQKLVTESSMLAAAVFWEGFVSDLFIAFVNRDTSAYASFAEVAVRQHAQTKFGADVVKAVSLELERHISAERVRLLLDSRGYNVTFKTGADLIQRARDWLALPYRNNFMTLAAAAVAFINAFSAIRDFLAHRSKSSKAKMAAALMVPTLARKFCYGTNIVHDVGAFLLSTRPDTPKTRFALYLAEMTALAARLCP